MIREFLRVEEATTILNSSARKPINVFHQLVQRSESAPIQNGRFNYCNSGEMMPSRSPARCSDNQLRKLILPFFGGL